MRFARVPVAFAAGAATLAVTSFQLHDRIWPSVTVQGGEVVAADVVAVGVSYGQYVTEHKLLFPHTKETLLLAGSKVTLRGAIVNVVLRMEGLSGRSCKAQYTVYRTPLTPVIGPRESLKDCTATVRDGDQGGWPAWVELPQKTRRGRNGRPVTHRYFIRFDLYDEDGRLIGPGKNSRVFGWKPEPITG